MKRTEMVRLCLEDALHGELYPLMGLIDWLIVDKKVPLARIIDLGERHFHVPRHNLLATLQYLS